MNLLNIDSPMARPLSRAEEDHLYGGSEQEREATDRTLHIIKSSPCPVSELDVGEYDPERRLLSQALSLAAGGRDDAVIAAAVKLLLAEVLQRCDASYWEHVDAQQRRILDAWHVSNSVASMACGLTVRSKA